MVLFGVVAALVAVLLTLEDPQETYFEANALEHYFFENPDQTAAVPFSDVLSGDWQRICGIGTGYRTDAWLDRELGPGWRLEKGRIVDEGLLEYLNKIVLIYPRKGVYVMNLDERVFGVTMSESCVSFDAATVTHSTELRDPDPDGWGTYFTEYEISGSE